MEYGQVWYSMFGLVLFLLIYPICFQTNKINNTQVITKILHIICTVLNGCYFILLLDAYYYITSNFTFPSQKSSNTFPFQNSPDLLIDFQITLNKLGICILIYYRLTINNTLMTNVCQENYATTAPIKTYLLPLDNSMIKREFLIVSQHNGFFRNLG